jgi:hypothetical protein
LAEIVAEDTQFELQTVESDSPLEADVRGLLHLLSRHGLPAEQQTIQQEIIEDCDVLARDSEGIQTADQVAPQESEQIATDPDEALKAELRTLLKQLKEQQSELVNLLDSNDGTDANAASSDAINPVLAIDEGSSSDDGFAVVEQQPAATLESVPLIPAPSDYYPPTRTAYSRGQSMPCRSHP